MTAPAADPPAARAPGPPGSLLLGNLGAMRRDPLGLLLHSFHRYGDVLRLRFAHQPAFLLAHPDHVQRVLVDNARNYSKRTRSIAQLREVMGDGLVTGEGETWRRHRALVVPALGRERIAPYAALMAAATADMLERWEHRARRDEPVDVAAEMSALTQRVVGDTLLGADLREEVAALGEAVGYLLARNRQELYRLLRRPDWLPTPTGLRVRRAKAALEAIVARIIAGRRAASAPGDDVVSRLLWARDAETGRGLSDREVRDEVMTLLLAGHETTANALAWTWLLLARHPEVQRRVAAEAERVTAGRAPGAEALGRLDYTTRVLQEAMRLYPPIWAISRRAEGEDRMDGYRIPTGALVVLSPYVTHRHPACWEHPERFDPQRFAAGQAEGRPRFAYFPFGGGPRGCIGEAFAMMEARLVLAMTACRFRLELEPGHPVEPQPAVTLRPLHGLRMRLRAEGPCGGSG